MRNPFASPLWRNEAFVRVWSAATVSIFGSLLTRIALPLVAILTLGAGPLEVAALRAVELVALAAVGLVAGAWVDRLRRRPILIWADLGRAVLLASIPFAFVVGVLTFWHLLVVAGLAAALTAFFDAADNAYLPSVVERERLVEANSALAASGSAAEFASFGISGFLVTLLSGPITIAIDAVTFVVSAFLLFTVRREEAAPPPPETRAPLLHEIRAGLAKVSHDGVLRAFAISQMLIAATWGIGGAVWFLFVLEELHIGAEIIGVVAAVGGVSSFIGAVIAHRSTTRYGVGRVAVIAMVMCAIGNAFVPLAPAAFPFIAVGFLIGQQLVTDSALTVYNITDVSIRQSIVPDRELGRVGSTFQVLEVVAQLIATIVAGVLAEMIGLRATAFLSPILALVAVFVLWSSPVRRLRDLPSMDTRDPAEVVVEVERDQPVGA